MDVVDKATRSRMMSGIKSGNTKPEIFVRRALHARGFRFSKHDTRLPGKPDLFLNKYGVAVFINGCFWHGHNCKYFRMPKTRKSFWKNKINTNRTRDQKIIKEIRKMGFRYCIVWECGIRGKNKDQTEHMFYRLSSWILYGKTSRQFK